MRTLTTAGILRNGYSTGIRNAAPLLGALFLWLITVWIPYLNVGTTIGLLGLIAAMGRGEVVSPTSIFRAEYRRRIGEFFLVYAFLFFGVLMGTVFLIIPGYVIAFTWALAPLLVIEKGLTPIDALQKSNELTQGHKWTMFAGGLLVSLTSNGVFALLGALGSKAHFILGGLIALVGFIVTAAASMGVQAYIYGVLTDARPSSPSDAASPSLSWGAFAGAAVCFGIAGAVGSMRPSVDDSELRGAAAAAAYAKPSKYSLPKASKVAPAPVVNAEPVDDAQHAEAPEQNDEGTLQADALAAEFIANPDDAKDRYNDQELELTGVVKEVNVSPMATIVRFSVPERARKLDSLYAMFTSKVSVRRGDTLTVRGKVQVMDYGPVTVTVTDAEVINVGGSVAKSNVPTYKPKRSRSR